MRRAALLLLCGLSLLLPGCHAARMRASAVAAPVAQAVPHELHEHGRTRIDDYYWLREREDPAVIEYLEAENRFTDAAMAHTGKLQRRLFREIRGRIVEDDSSVPYRLHDYFYYVRYEKGRDYPIYCRKPGTLDAQEQIMLDVNELAAGHEYFAVRSAQVSRGQEILAFAADDVGRRIYTIRFKNLATGEMLPDEIPATTANLDWANDNRTLFYAKQDPLTLRPHRIYRHTLGRPSTEDVLVYEERDDTFATFVFKTKSERYIMIGSEQTLSSEYRYLDANDPSGEFRVLQPRERDHEYSVDHYGDAFYIKTNMGARNFRLVEAPVARPDKRHWVEVIPHREDVLLEDFEIFRDYLVLVERRNGLVELRVRPWSGQGEYSIDFGEPAYVAYPTNNHDFDTTVLRYGYSSMTTPTSKYDYDMLTREKVLLKQDRVLGGFDSRDYVTERRYAVARDGTRVPISLVRRKTTAVDGRAPLLLYGYGSYGSSIDARFSAARLSLLDRGFVFAIAHVRGGQELGRQWYEDGKLLRKKNTFTDFIDCAEYLAAEGYADPRRLFAQGGSAGGLLIGAVVNMRPGLFRGVIAAVPFVDVVSTMLDDSIPLTTGEFDEWGNPADETYYEYMLSYSPYDNVGAQAYPHMLVTTGLHDSQVQYWEPAKWVAKLRATKTDDHRLLLKTNMDAGHGGASGRFRRYEETAFQYAFLLDLAGSAD